MRRALRLREDTNMLPGMRVASRNRDQIKEAKEALNKSFLEFKSVGEIASKPDFVYTVAELVRQIAVDEFNLTDVSPLFVDRESAELGQTIELEETINTMRCVRRSPGSLPLAFTPVKRKFPIVTAEYDLPFWIDLERVLRRQVEPSLFAEHAAQALSRTWTDTILDAVDAAATGNDHYGRALRFTKSGDIDATTLDAALRALGDVNSDVIIAGRFYALFPITGFTSGFSDIALEEIRATGLIGRYKGARVVVLKDDYNFFTGETTIPANRIYLLGGMKGTKLHERNVSALNYQSMDPEKAQIKSGFRVDFGVTVLQAWRQRVIELT